MEKFDLAVLGLGPAGHFGAIQAAKAGKKVVAIESEAQVGGASATNGTIPSKALREAVMHLSGVRQRAFYGKHYRVKDQLSIRDLTHSTQQIVAHEVSTLEAQLKRNGVQVVYGHGSFIGTHQLVSEGANGVRVFDVDKVLVAVGSRPAQARGLAFDGRHIIDSNQILKLDRIPRRLIVVGAGVIGVEYACIFSAIGVAVTLVNQSENFLEFLDRQLSDVLRVHMQSQKIDLRFGEKVVDVHIDREDRVVVHTESNKTIVGDCVLYSVGRQGNTDFLNLEASGLSADTRGRLKVNPNYQTEQPHIYAAGDVIGFPALAATSREQGRRAVCHAFDLPRSASDEYDLPYGIYAIPEISTFGPSEADLTRDGIPYEVGRAWYGEIARGHLLGDQNGFLKLVFDPWSLKLISVHAIGDGATELIHIGQAVKALGGTIEYFVETVFNYPTLAECYKVAALDGLNRACQYRNDAALTQGIRRPEPTATATGTAKPNVKTTATGSAASGLTLPATEAEAAAEPVATAG